MKKLLLTVCPLVTAICVVIFWVFMATANASWQLIPGQPFDGQGPRRPNYNYIYTEPCWSIATSKCSQERQQKQLNRAKRISR
jgi:hypothetical protein